MSEEMLQTLDERHHLNQQRADAVLRGALTDNEARTVALGPTPQDRKQRAVWWRAARTVAAHRDRHQITDDHAPLGVAPITTRQKIDAARASSHPNRAWWKNLGLGLTSGLLNPKNALFYVSVAAAVAAASPPALVLYGVWMVSVLLLWDIFVAVALGSARALERMGRFLPWLTRVAGGFLILFGTGMMASLAIHLAR